MTVIFLLYSRFFFAGKNKFLQDVMLGFSQKEYENKQNYISDELSLMDKFTKHFLVIQNKNCNYKVIIIGSLAALF